MIPRRDFLKIGLSVAAGARPLLALQDPPPRVKSVVWLWMDGGMSQGHTWDPQANSNPIDTAVEGIRISEGLPLCAAQMKNLSIIRSMSHPYGDHAVATTAMHTGEEPRPGGIAPAFGTIFGYEAGKRVFPLPRYLVLGPPADLPRSPAFDEEFHPFQLGSVRSPLPDREGLVSRDRDRERAALLAEQNKDWSSTRAQRAVTALDRAFLQSEEAMTSPTLRAFDTHEEPAVVRKAYGEGFGEACLLARRLVEAGCPFVEIGLKGWAGDSPFKESVSALDRGLGNLLKDLAGRNLLRETLVVCATAFGKDPFTPSSRAWNRAFSVAVAGGTLAGGRVYGRTTGDNAKPPVSIKDFFATLYKACGLDAEKTYEFNGRQIKYVRGGKPVDDLF